MNSAFDMLVASINSDGSNIAVESSVLGQIGLVHFYNICRVKDSCKNDCMIRLRSLP